MDFIDQMGRQITLSQWPPRRIISLVPSQTEYLADLDLHEEVQGITKFCIYPRAWFEEKQRIGGTKTLDYQKIDALQPDLIIGNKEENDQEQIEFLSQRYPVWMSDIATLDDALQMMRSTGELTGKSEKANFIADEIEHRFLQSASFNLQRYKVAYMIWRKPYLTVGSGTFIDDMLRHAGFENVFKSLTRYPEISSGQLAVAQPELVFLSSEPYPFAEKHVEALREICPNARIMLVDGAMFSWYGSRLLQVPAYFAELRQKLANKKAGVRPEAEPPQ